MVSGKEGIIRQMLEPRQHLQIMNYWKSEPAEFQKTEEAPMQMKAVFHIDEIEKWNLLIANVQNLLKAITESMFEIEIVANSAAVKEYLINDSNFTDELTELSTKGIKICACKNALNGLNIKQDEIFEFVTIVPVGVKELIEKQNDGFAYIKP